ncbi:MAG: hypothetical protein IT458_01025 [Planctomycetes bacterium]|nr:hypothetical protein [Planctomycetota bacterium]
MFPPHRATQPDETPSPEAPAPVLLEQRVVAWSQDRTLVARRTGPSGPTELVKVFETGSLADAEVEAALAQRLALDGLVRVRGARLDPVSRRPSVVLDHHEGADLEAYVATEGPLSPGAAARVACEVGRTLLLLHGTAVPGLAPHGVLHRDVKPGNVLLVGRDPDPRVARVLLLDPEHMRPLAPQAGTGMRVPAFTGGTHGYAPPEAYEGEVPNRAFDVFGLGALLHFALTGAPPFAGRTPEELGAAVRQGRRRRWLLAGQPEALRILVENLLATEPRLRPSLEQALVALEPIASGGDAAGQALDAILAHVQRGELVEAQAKLEPLDPTLAHERRALDLAARIRHLGRLLERVPWLEPAAPPDDPRQLAEWIEAEARRAAATLLRMPAHPEALAGRPRLAVALARLIGEVPPLVATMKRAGRLNAAERLLDAALRAVHASTLFPARLAPAFALAEGALPTPMQRDPQRMLRHALEDVRRENLVLSRMLADLQEAEAQLDLDRANASIEAVAALYTGANEVVGGLKERLHRLNFYVDRIARARPQIEVLQQQLLQVKGGGADLGPLIQVQERCVRSARPDPDSSAVRPPASLRALQRLLQDLAAEFSHALPVVQPALRVLDQASQTLTDHGTALLEEARAKLARTPIPIRPLQNALASLDALRLLDVLVDRPGRSRAEVLDEIERVRLKVEQARMTRDRLARGARRALERGHITTALFDMERAVDQFGGETDEQVGERPLAHELEAARLRKREVEEGAARNVTLATRYAMLCDDPASSADDRIAILAERRATLLLLVGAVPDDRAAAYRQDLRDVQVAMLQEEADRLAKDLAGIEDPEQRLRRASEFLERLHAATRDPALGDAPLGRIERLRERVAHHVDRAQAELRTRASRAEEAAAQVRRSRVRRVAAVVAAALLLLAGSLLWRAFGPARNHVVAAAGVHALLGRPFPLTDAELAHARLRAALAELQRVHGERPQARAALAAAGAMLDALTARRGPEPHQDPRAVLALLDERLQACEVAVVDLREHESDAAAALAELVRLAHATLLCLEHRAGGPLARELVAARLVRAPGPRSVDLDAELTELLQTATR